jgi:hypothetical protein
MFSPTYRHNRRFAFDAHRLTNPRGKKESGPQAGPQLSKSFRAE